MRIFLFLLALLFSTPVFAQVDTSGLSAAQKAEVVLQIEKMKGEGSSPDRMKQYAEVGTEIGTAIAATAHQLSVSVTEFASTPVGKWTMFLITWKVMGQALIHVAGGVLWFMFMIPIWFYMYRRVCVIQSVTKSGTGLWGTGLWRTKEVVYRDPDTDYLATFIAVLFVICVAGAVMIFTL
jgi:hypothetical protein